MKKILVTGGAGYIGSIAVEKLINTGYNVSIVDNLSTGNKLLINPNAKFYNIDLCKKEKIEKICKENQFDAVIHFASFSQVSESFSNPEKYFFNNCVGSLNLLEACKNNNIKKIIFSSTASIFGESNQKEITEHHEKNPQNPYGSSKLMIEKMLNSYQITNKIEYCIFRYFNAAGASDSGMYGEMHDPETHLIPIILQVANKKREKLYIYGNDYKTQDGTCIRDYIHVEDLITAHIKGLEYLFNGGKSQEFNLGNGKGYSVLEIINTARSITSKEIPIEISEKRKGDPAVLIASSQKAEIILKWKPKKTLEEIIQSAWDWEKRIN